MKPVDQTIFGDGSNGAVPGNCFAACVASLFELPVEEVPHFVAIGGNEFWNVMLEWMRPRGFYAISVPYSPHFYTPVITIVSGRGPRGFDHSVLWQNGQMIHDPHPSRAGLLEPVYEEYVVALDPARLRA